MSEAATQAAAPAQRSVIVGLQMLRAVAAIMVVAHHASIVLLQNDGYDPIWSFADVGSRGVELFFVLSGFIICYAHWRDPGTAEAAGRYVYNRLVRIIPPAFVVATGWFLVALVAARQGIDTSSMGELDLGLWLSSALIVPMLRLPSPIVIWSLKHEMAFYAVFLSRYVSKRFAILAIVGWGGASLLLPAATDNHLVKMLSLNLNALFTFGVGVYFAWRDPRVMQWFERFAPFLTIVSAAVFAALCIRFRAVTSYENMTPLLFGCSASVLILSVIPLTLGPAATRIAKLWGDASYAIYLCHFPIVIVGYKALAAGGVARPVMFLVLLVAGSVGGLVFHLWVEAPMTRWFRRRAGRTRTAVPQPS